MFVALVGLFRIEAVLVPFLACSYTFFFLISFPDALLIYSLVLADMLVHVELGLSELHLIHALTSVTFPTEPGIGLVVQGGERFPQDLSQGHVCKG